MMKKLYVSDLDGTLLDKNATLPPRAAELLRELDSRGVAITYATARTIQSVRHILADAPVRYPVALMNGVVICDLADGERCISAAYFKEEDFTAVRETLAACGVTPFMYFLNDGKLSTAYTEISNKYMENFMRERVEKYNKPFIRLSDGDAFPGSPIYFAAMDAEDKIRRANEACLKLPRIKTACYRDSYEPDFWYLEVFDESASKKNATETIRRLTGAERVIAFGDNFNDVPMFEASDECYAVRTAPAGVISAADGVVDSADELGVAYKIAELEGISLTENNI